MSREGDALEHEQLTAGEMGMYSRHLLIPAIGIKGQLALKNASVLMIGAGGLGCPALLYLAAAGVGRLGIIDADQINVSNVHRQVLFRITDEGQNKVDVAKRRLQKLNPYIEIETWIERFNLDNAQALVADYDIIVDGTDNFTAKYLINDACFYGGKPLVYGAIMQFEGHVTVFNALDEQGRRGANYRDLYDGPPDAALAPNCAEAGVLGVLPGMIGCFQANEVIKLITGIGRPLVNRLMVYDALEATSREIVFSPVGDNPLRDPLRQPVLEEMAQVCSAPGVTDDFMLSIEDFAELISETSIHLIDVREGHEREQVSIGGEHVPLEQVGERVAQCLSDRPIVLYCQSGVRSHKVARILAQQALRSPIFSLKGGLSAFLGADTYAQIMAELVFCKCPMSHQARV